MFDTIRNAWKIADLRKKILFTALILLIFRIGSAIPVPFLDASVMQDWMSNAGDGNLLGYIDVLTGGAFSNATIFAMSISPYITGSIVIQLLTVAIPALERMSKEGEDGRKRLNRITRYTGIGLGFVQALAYWFLLKNQGALVYTSGFSGFFSAVVIIMTFTAGSALIVFLGDQIDARGIGNGISMILFANIISRIPDNVISLVTNLSSGAMKWWGATITLVGVAALVLLIVFINDAERRIPIQYAKRVVGRKVYGGQNTNLPIKVNMSGVMPVIFAQSIASLPATIFAFTSVQKGVGFWGTLRAIFDSDSWFYAFLYFILIIGFAYFYAAVQYDPMEIANNLKKNGGFIPGFRPGKPTADFIAKVIHKITFFGAIYLAIVALLPIIAGNTISGVQALGIGGTSVIIVVGVALETVQALEAQMLMRHYKGFLE